MMSKTHITVGIGTALAVSQPHTAQECCMAIIGGAVGGIIPDVDILDNDHTGDARLGQSLALGLTLFALPLMRSADLASVIKSSHSLEFNLA